MAEILRSYNWTDPGECLELVDSMVFSWRNRQYCLVFINSHSILLTYFLKQDFGCRLLSFPPFWGLYTLIVITPLFGAFYLSCDGNDENDVVELVFFFVFFFGLFSLSIGIPFYIYVGKMMDAVCMYIKITFVYLYICRRSYEPVCFLL